MKNLPFIGGAILSAALLLGVIGCEGGHNDKKDEISPRITTLAVGESVNLTMADVDYNDWCEWSLSDKSIGKISGGKGATVVYTATRPGSQTVSVKVFDRDDDPPHRVELEDVDSLTFEQK